MKKSYSIKFFGLQSQEEIVVHQKQGIVFAKLVSVNKRNNRKKNLAEGLDFTR